MTRLTVAQEIQTSMLRLPSASGTHLNREYASTCAVQAVEASGVVFFIGRVYLRVNGIKPNRTVARRNVGWCGPLAIVSSDGICLG